MDTKQIFALDIGTRSVVGLIVEETPGGLKVIACEGEEHRNRAMVDGQIHDVDQVAEVIRNIKGRLEAKIGRPLREVAVAAAGRALKTIECEASRDISDLAEVTKEDVLALELQAVQSAQAILLEGEPADQVYHCVGYSIVHSYLNGERIGNLVGQQGEYMALEVLATFLPRVVVDSMFSALSRVNLEILSLTLEPIAASQVVIPPNMRQLNIALVDVGAGTSDIAISSEGTIVAYGMVPEAGDELTETLCQEYLLDFQEGERIKRLVHKEESITFKDILGVEQSLNKDEIINITSPKVQNLALKIGEKILALSHKPPQAVILIGGGSLTPLLPEKLADYLGLSYQRVAVRGTEAITGFEGLEFYMSGPEYITPLGIALVAKNGNNLGFGRVTVNGRQVRIFELNQGKVADALIGAGINIKKIYGRPGMALTVTVNGQLKIIKGESGTPAKIKVNGVEAHLDTPIKSNDAITVEQAVNGRDANGRIADVIPNEGLEVLINGRLLKINGEIIMNGKQVEKDYYLEDRADIQYTLPGTLTEILHKAGLNHYLDTSIIKVNGTEAQGDYQINDGDSINIDIKNKQSDEIITIDLEESQEPASNTEVLQEIKAPDETVKVQSHLYVNNEEVIIPGGMDNLLFLDIFNHVNFSTNPPQKGAILVMEVNGDKAEFTTPIGQGDRLVLQWKVNEE
ncbi:MAG: cell division protein FtsA [Clostridia bacterium]|nr:cell division protein FtsA [Clostridia bacterium]